MTRPDLTPEFRRVAVAARRLRQARAEYHAAILAADRAGAEPVDIGKAAGITRQSARALVARARARRST